MKCTEAERWISMRVDGEAIPEASGQKLESHLAGCAACRRTLEVESGRARLLATTLAAAPGGRPGLEAEIVRTAGPEMELPASRTWLRPGLFGLVPVALALTVVSAAGLWFYLAPGNPGGLRPVAAGDAGNYVIEQSSRDTDVVPSEDGAPVSRDIEKTHWIYVIPASSRDQSSAGELKLDVERVDTRYIRMIDWDYR